MLRPTRLPSLAALVLAALLVHAPDAHAIAYLAGLGSVQKSSDAGTNWSPTGATGGELDGIQFLNDNVGIGVGVLGRALRTTNGGTSWTTGTTPTTNNLVDVSMASDSIGYAVGAGVALRTTNGGQTWSAINFPSGACWGLGVWFTSSTTGVMISDCGGIYRTTNSGSSWSSVVSGTSARLEDIMFPSATVGWIVGFSHTILKTTDGGATWTPQTSPVTNVDFKGVYFLSTTTGWVVGTNGVVLFTTDGGATWTQRGTPAGNRELRCVGFANAQEGIIGGAGVNLRTLDGGLSWIEVFPATDNFQEIAVRPSTPITGTVNVTVTSNPAGRHVVVDGADWSAATTFRWLAGEPHRITADATQAVSANEQYVFASWSDGGARDHTVSRTSNATLTVTYTHQYKLTMQVGTPSGTVSPATGFKDAGTTVAISATPSAGYTFGNWAGTGTGSFTGTTATANVTMNGPITQSANFVAGPVSVTFRSSPSGRTVVVDGATLTTPATVTWTVGTSHAISTATPQAGAAGTQFAWTGWSDGGARSHNVTASVATTTYTANFKTQYLLTMTVPPSPWTTTPTTGYFDAGSTVAIAATKDPLQFSTKYFYSWTGSGPGSYTGVFQQASVTLNGPITQTADFTSLPSRIVWVGTQPTGLAFQVAGTPCTDTTAFRFLIGSSFAVSTDSLQAANGSTRQRFLQWSDGGLDSHTVAMGLDGPDTLIATFRTQYMLTMVGDTGVVVSPASGYRDRLSSVFIQATPLPFFGWQGWTGAGSGAYNGTQISQVITLSGPITQTARVTGVPIPQRIVTNSPVAQFTVDGTLFTGSQTLTWLAGSPHTIAAVSPLQIASGTRLVFQSWSDQGAPSHVVAPLVPDTLSLSMKTLYLLTVSAGAGGSVTPSTGYFAPGQVVLTATPDSGKVFLGWTGSGTSGFTGTTNPLLLDLQGPTTESAAFAAPAGVEDDAPLAFALAQNAPNPVRGRGTSIAFALPAPAEVTLEVLDLAGRRIATLAQGRHEAGHHTVRWDADDDAGRPLAGGLYFYRLRSEGRWLVRRMIVTR